MSSPTSPTSATSDLSSCPTTPSNPCPSGLLWVQSCIQNPALAEPDLTTWYEEHTTDVLDCPGNGGLMLRYKNLDTRIPTHSNPEMSSRAGKSDSEVMEIIKSYSWPYLAIVKCTDLNWLSSKEYIDMPRWSKNLPKQADGSWGTAYESWHAALRSYELISRETYPSSKEQETDAATTTTTTTTTTSTVQPKYLLSFQLLSSEPKIFEELNAQYTKVPRCRGLLNMKVSRAYLGYQEPAPVPEGLAIYEFDGEMVPEVEVESDMLGVVRKDGWGLTAERGDMRLRL